MRILINHLGYDAAAPKKAIIQQSGRTGGAASAAGRLQSPESEISTASAEPGVEPGSLFFEVRHLLSGQTRAKGSCEYRGIVDRWRQGRFWELDFSELTAPGAYRLEIYGSGEEGGDAEGPLALSAAFEISTDLIFRETFSNLLFWFKGERSSGAEDRADRRASFYGGRPGTADLRGGWFDASGDTSKYLSHLSYANYLNPQQTPGVVWAMLAARDLLVPVKPAAPALYERRLLDEIAWGADFLLRMQDPEGYFYLTLFDQWSKDLDRRLVSSFRTQEGERGVDYQAGYRQGGGMAVASLARAAAVGLAMAADGADSAPRDLRGADSAPRDLPGADSAPGDLPGAPGRGAKPPENLLPGEYSAGEYLFAAARGFDHLEERNLAYLDDGRENIIDDYCALLAATELCLAAAAAGKANLRGPETYLKAPEAYLHAARRRADSLRGRLATDAEGRRYWLAGAGDRPYYHAAEAGLPVMALLRYAECEARLGDEARGQGALEVAQEAMAAELEVTAEVPNPFGYARQHVAEPGAEKRTSYFIPHRNESGYWWQGENARIASLAAAALMIALGADGNEHSAPRESPAPRNRGGVEGLHRYAVDQINWILGLNPFDICMFDGLGRNNPEYEAAYPNAPGGICNGITAGVEDEGDIAFLPEPWGDDPLHRWRWSEQWIPHGGWFLLAISALNSAR